MKDQHIKEIREACIKANPSILDLTFGCEVDRGAGKDIHEFVVGQFNDAIALVRSSPYGIGYFLPFEVPTDLVSSWKILGRPIRLADVFLAIETQLGSGKKIVWDARESLVKHVVRRWNLRADRVEDQSTETLAFLAELLKQP